MIIITVILTELWAIFDSCQKSTLFDQFSLEQSRQLHIGLFFSHKKKQRDQLFAWIQEQREELGSHHEDGELQQTEECMSEVKIP